jgi:hypothetical protein
MREEDRVDSRRVLLAVLTMLAGGCAGSGAGNTQPDTSPSIQDAPDVGIATDVYSIATVLPDVGASIVGPEVSDNHDAWIAAPDVAQPIGSEVGDVGGNQDGFRPDAADAVSSSGPDAKSGPDSSPIAPVPYESIPQCRVNGTGALFTVSNAGSCAPYSIPAGTPGVSGQVPAIYPVLPSDAGVIRQLVCMGSCYKVGSVTNEYTITSVCRTEAYSSDGSLWGYVVCLPPVQIDAVNTKSGCGACGPAPIPTVTTG